MDDNHRLIPARALLTIHKQNKELIFERSEENFSRAIEMARKFYGKSGVHRINIQVGGVTQFEFTGDINRLSPDTQHMIKVVKEKRTGPRKCLS